MFCSDYFEPYKYHINMLHTHFEHHAIKLSEIRSMTVSFEREVVSEQSYQKIKSTDLASIENWIENGDYIMLNSFVVSSSWSYVMHKSSTCC